MNLFYDPDFSSDYANRGIYFLNPEESWHCAKVLRMQQGQNVHVTNGKGSLFKGILEHVDPKGCKIRVGEISEQARSNFSIHLAVAPIKNMARYEWFLEKAAEIGIDRITPLICERSEKISIRHDRLVRVVIAAMKQSLACFCPVVDSPVSFNDFVQSAETEGNFIAWCSDQEEQLFGKVCKPNSAVLVLIGPEGDFTTEEVRRAQTAGFIPISLGKKRLRTETAALTACIVVHTLNGKI